MLGIVEKLKSCGESDCRFDRLKYSRSQSIASLALGSGRPIVVSIVILIFILLSLGAIIRGVFWLTGVPGNPGLEETATSILVVAFIVALVTAFWTYRSMRRRIPLEQV